MVFIDAHNNDYKWKESFLSWQKCTKFQIWKLTWMNQFLMMLPSWNLSFMNCKHHVLIFEQWLSQSKFFPGALFFEFLRIGKIAIVSISVHCSRNQTANAELQEKYKYQSWTHGRIKCTRARALGKWVTGPMISLHEPITWLSFLSCAGGQTDGWTDKSPMRCTEGQTNRRTVEITKRTVLKRSQDFYLKFSLRADLPMLSNRRRSPMRHAIISNYFRPNSDVIGSCRMSQTITSKMILSWDNNFPWYMPHFECYLLHSPRFGNITWLRVVNGW